VVSEGLKAERETVKHYQDSGTEGGDGVQKVFKTGARSHESPWF